MSEPTSTELTRKPGRPSSFKTEYVELARQYCQSGANDTQLADLFDVSTKTIQRWRAEHLDFRLASKLGKDESDENVINSLYHRATGYSHPAVKIFPPKSEGGQPVIVNYVEHVAPDTTAAIFWLKNRRPGEWRDQRNVRIAHDFSDLQSVEQIVEAVKNELGEHVARKLIELVEAGREPEAALLELTAERHDDSSDESMP